MTKCLSKTEIDKSFLILHLFLFSNSSKTNSVDDFFSEKVQVLENAKYPFAVKGKINKLKSSVNNFQPHVSPSLLLNSDKIHYYRQGMTSTVDHMQKDTTSLFHNWMNYETGIIDLAL